MERPLYLPFKPALGSSAVAWKLLEDAARLAVGLNRVGDDRCRQEETENRRTQAIHKCQACRGQARQALLASTNVLFDLVKQGWAVRVADGKVLISRPTPRNDDDERAQIRRQLHAERDAQLRQDSVRAFVRSMETPRLFNHKIVSIFSLIRDGRDLAAQLGTVITEQSDTERNTLLCHVIQPRLHFVRGEERCELTGFRLIDIWRYFRHTWAMPYKSVPGRSMMVLVRDSAHPFNPVIGIAALSSATVGLDVRDQAIGWTLPVVMHKIREGQPEVYGRWMLRTTETAIEELYKDDFLRHRVFSPSDLHRPGDDIIKGLIEIGRTSRSDHYRLMQAEDYKDTGDTAHNDDYWIKQAETPLFRAKRALELAGLLKVRRVLLASFAGPPTGKEVLALLEQPAGREALARIIRRAKSDRVGTVMADLTVCGAVPPYGEVLGGKLVAMLMASPEVIAEYRRRYRNTASIIASSMAGKPIIRPAKLVFISTTSLFGVRPNQYDRLSLPCEQILEGAAGAIRYDFLGQTKGIGTFQFGPATVESLALLLAQGARGQRVNSVFGEGVNPRLRKIRDGLDALQLPASELLSHGTSRLVYGAHLARNTAEYLLGLDGEPDYLLSPKSGRSATDAIARWWIARWLCPRLLRDDMLQRIARHTLVHPITHGARVDLPEMDADRERIL